jgi:phage tail-like protein
MIAFVKLEAALLSGMLFLAASPAAKETAAISGKLTIKIEIESVTQGLFQAVEGLRSESEVLEAAGGEDSVALPGSRKWSHLVLKRTYDPVFNGLWRWRQSVLEGNVQKRDGRIILFNASGEKVAQWMFHRGWPSRWEVPTLEASTEMPGVETVEIVHEGLSLEE